MNAFSIVSGVGRSTWGGADRLWATILGIVEARGEIRQEREGVLMYARQK